MIKNKELNISSIFIEIKKSENKEEILSNFYYNDKEKWFIKNKLVKETFEEYILNFITKSNNYNLNIINLYIIIGDLEQNENNIRESYNKYQLKNIKFWTSHKIWRNHSKNFIFCSRFKSSTIIILFIQTKYTKWAFW